MIFGVLSAALVALLTGSTVSGLYVYVPNVLVVSTGSDADTVLSQLEVSLGVQPADDPIWADRPDLKRVDRTAAVMQKHWERLDAACDPNAVFALMYLMTTYGVRYHIANHYFADNDYLSIITVSFAKMYLDSYEAWKRGDRGHATRAWLEAFDYAASGQSTITEDEFLGMNAHINYDLALAIAALGTTSASGQYRKPDMDRINHVLADVTDEVGYMISLYYGPTPPTAQPNWGEGHDASTEPVLYPIFAWRENAWNNALLIESLPDAQTRAAHDAYLQETSWTIAQGFHSPKLTSPAPERLAYCQVHP